MCNSARSFQMHLVKCCIRPVAHSAGAYLSSLTLKHLQLRSIFTPPWIGCLSITKFLPQGLTKSAIRSSEKSRFSWWTSNMSFSHVQWERTQASCLPTKYKKYNIKTWSGQAKFESYLSEGQALIQVFLKPWPHWSF